jgi:L-amino acid N-acyltransferase YncA
LIRDARESDLPAIVDIYNSTVPSRMVTADTAPVSVKDRTAWFHEHKKGFRPLWVVEEDGKVIAWLSFQSFYGRPAYLGTAELSVYVAEGHRRQGLGRVLLERAIEHCPEIGVKNLIGFIFAHNGPSIGLVESLGFERWGYFPKVAVLDGIERDLVVMGLRIQK